MSSRNPRPSTGSERDLACAQRDVLQARVAALETASEGTRGRTEDIEDRDGVKVEHGKWYQLVPKLDPVSAGASTDRYIKSSMSGASRGKRVLNTTQLSNNVNHAEHLTTNPTESSAKQTDPFFKAE
ncbi:BZ3500_MvSof-1268-A1-R1_Chr11-2g03427 [Microbotryum saponariae]|uniref:BZ3500_MvSof-1268-A1-R1_Chr11-2g03427 protein n=1 Tax=Microbotryum saponariae TaxID=289078 RepID=A0A2X0LVJ5_9BASI|nr:BZ3500_MvSof-1268-A1-R1_Chr11-2g03427 [Microbotryum saponariae]SDA03353.1 BZ3501_MvSof-1269-A2-R1_Chr11g02998 [Microbotryum saponariae]